LIRVPPPPYASAVAQQVNCCTSAGKTSRPGGKNVKTPPLVNTFFRELKRRRVFRAAAAYAVAGWILIQAGEAVLPAFDAPNWVLQSIIVLVALGFPIVLMLAWAFDISTGGVKREAQGELDRGRTRRLAWLLAIIGIGTGALLVLAVHFIWRPYESSDSPAAAPQAEIAKSIAVLPFDNLSDDKQNSYFAEGVHEEILTALSKIADLRVISRTSVMQYRDASARNLRTIAQELNVAHVLEGSVRRMGNRVRVTAQLIDARTDAHLWAENYDRDVADVFAIQSEIAQQIAHQLQARLSPTEQARMDAQPTTDLPAYDFYLKAQEIARAGGANTAERLIQQIGLLDQAIGRDPSFVPALCLLARAHLAMYWFNHDHTPARLDLARRPLETAARLQPDAAEVHLTRALLHYWGSRDYSTALQHLDRARRADPNDAEIVLYFAMIERRMAKWDESTRHLEEATTMDPRNATLWFALGDLNYMALKRYNDAARALEHVLTWRPRDFEFERSRARVDVAARADLTRLRRVVETTYGAETNAAAITSTRLELAMAERNYTAAAEALAAHPLPAFTAAGFVTPRELYEGIIARATSDHDRAQAAFLTARERAAETAARRPDDPKALIVLAEIDARLGNRDEAIRNGEAAAAALPPSRDAVDGPWMITRLAGIYAQLGDADRALDRLEETARMPLGPSFGMLRLDEVWDPLRGNARFEAVVASLAP
jgi:TolB-like protein